MTQNCYRRAALRRKSATTHKSGKFEALTNVVTTTYLGQIARTTRAIPARKRRSEATIRFKPNRRMVLPNALERRVAIAPCATQAFTKVKPARNKPRPKMANAHFSSTTFTGRPPGAGGNRLAKSRRRATLAPPLRRSAAWMADRARPTRNSMKRSCVGTGLSRLLHGVNRGQIGTGAAFRQRPQPAFGLAALFHAVHGLGGLFHGPIGAH